MGSTAALAQQMPPCPRRTLKNFSAGVLNGHMEKSVTIYVALLNEGTDCWRPVSASLQDDGLYLLSGLIPELEEWEFSPGATVRCEHRKFADGKVRLVAIEQVR